MSLTIPENTLRLKHKKSPAARLNKWAGSASKKVMQTSNQQPATLKVKFNLSNWYIQRSEAEKINQLKKEKATIVRYFPTSGTIHYTLQENSIGYKIWNVSRGYLTAHINSTECELKVTQDELEAHFRPVNELEDLDVNDLKTDEHFWDTFGKSETESFMRWLVIECQKAGKFQPVRCSHAHETLCCDGLLTDFGDFFYVPTRKAIRILAGKGFYKPQHGA